MANINLLHELLMFAKTSGRKMAVKETVEEYYSHYLEDCCHTPAVRLISQEYKLREILSSSVLKENQKALVYGLTSYLITFSRHMEILDMLVVTTLCFKVTYVK